MPCDGSHNNPTDLEIEGTKAAYVIEELLSGKHVPKHEFYRGYHPRVYDRSGPVINEVIASACSKIKARREAELPHIFKAWLSGRSLELQIWWRDHEEMDARKEAAREAAEEDALKGVNNIVAGEYLALEVESFGNDPRPNLLRKALDTYRRAPSIWLDPDAVERGLAALRASEFMKQFSIYVGPDGKKVVAEILLAAAKTDIPRAVRHG